MLCGGTSHEAGRGSRIGGAGEDCDVSKQCQHTTARAGGAESCLRAVPFKFCLSAPPLVMMDTVKAYWEYLVWYVRRRARVSVSASQC